MAFSGKMYGQLPLHLALKRLNLTADAIRATLHTVTYVPNQDTNAFQSDLTNELATGGGYTAGGVLLTGVTVTYDAATNVTKLDSNDIVITSSTLTWRVLVLSDATPGTALTNPLIAYFVSDVDVISSGGDTTIVMPAAGFATFTPAA